MGKIFDRLKAAAGESGLRNALGRWRQEVSNLLDSSGGIVVLENGQLAVDVDIPVTNSADLLTSSVHTVNGASRSKTALIRVGLNARLGTGDTSVSAVVTLQVSANGGPFATLSQWQSGTFDLDTQYLCSVFEQSQPITTDATVQYRLQVTALGTPTDVLTVDALTGGAFAFMTVQISNDPE